MNRRAVRELLYPSYVRPTRRAFSRVHERATTLHWPGYWLPCCQFADSPRGRGSALYLALQHIKIGVQSRDLLVW